MKTLFVSFLTMISSLSFGATELTLKDQVPIPQVANMAEVAILSRCDVAARYADELRVRRYEYRKSTVDGQVILHHTVVIVFDYGTDFIDFVRVRVDELHPQGTFAVGAIESPDICDLPKN
ncbi:MAG: hypothetical protein BroJett040_18190 [Oligoflexia bacterium]|nr:MAG: hypothetical protein BroJett040_18190 [Oligoflexia bacterium]